MSIECIKLLFAPFFELMFDSEFGFIDINIELIIIQRKKARQIDFDRKIKTTEVRKDSI